MQAITLEVILRAVFGVSDEQRRDRLRAMLRELLDSTAAPGLQLGVLLARRLGWQGPFAQIAALRAGVDDVLAEEIGERRADPLVGEREDILSQLVAARFEDGSAMDDAELRDQLLTLLVAGHETTATALAWTFDLLLRSPAALTRLAGRACGRRRRVPARGRHRVAAAAPDRPARRAAAGLGAARRRPSSCRPGPTSRRRSG